MSFFFARNLYILKILENHYIKISEIYYITLNLKTSENHHIIKFLYKLVSKNTSKKYGPKILTPPAVLNTPGLSDTAIWFWPQSGSDSDAKTEK